MSGTWQNLTNAPGFSASTMLLLTDGSVLCHDEPNSGGVSATNHWYRLVPDASGSYLNGTWHQVANSHTAPLYFACSVLGDGRVFIAGGEYNGTQGQVEQLTAEIYDPIADTWTNLPTPAGWTNIGDAPSVVLDDNRVLLGNINNKQTAIYDPATNTWAAGPNKDDTRCTEETWVLMPDQTVLCLECDRRPRAEKYVMAANQWVTAGSTPVALVDAPSDEIGASVALPDGRAFCIGATGNTALYTMPAIANQPGTWAAGPTFPVIVAGKVTGAKDAPACLMPNGKVLCLVGPFNSAAGEWGQPVYFFEYDPAANTLTQAPAPSNSGGNPFSSRLMLLPTGQVLHANGTQVVAIYTPDGAPDPAWRPSITSVPNVLHPGDTYTLHGRQINGLSQAVIYGDEGSMATNYPIVRLTDSGGQVIYCRTRNHSTMGIQTGMVIHSTEFTVPNSAPFATYCLSVIANGIASVCSTVAVTHKIWKEIKWEIKEVKELKENVKWEHDGLKLVVEDLRKISEIDQVTQFGDEGWGEVIKALVQRSDELEGQLRAFIKKGERPEVAVFVQPRDPNAPKKTLPHEDEKDKGRGKKGKGGRSKKSDSHRRKPARS